MKRIICICLTLLLCCGIAAADVAWEPKDSFYHKHIDACKLESRNYEANGEKGWVQLFEQPNSQWVASAQTNGTVLYVEYIYTEPDGERWGKVGSIGGWVRLSECLERYDNTVFCREHGDEFVEHEYGVVNLANYLDTADETVEIPMYEYPGGQLDCTIPVKADELSFWQTWTDENGLEWGSFGYYHGVRNAWVCLSDPLNDALPQREVSTGERIPPQPITLMTRINNTVAIAVALVLAVVVVTVFLLVRHKRKQTA